MDIFTASTWLPVVGYEGLYEVSYDGDVRSAKTKRLRAFRYSPNGYLQVTLYKKMIPQSFMVHRLVATAFIGPCPEGHQVHHKDADKENNCAENLEYVTRLQNAAYAVAAGNYRTGSKNHRAKINEDTVRQIRRMAKTKSGLAISNELGLPQDMVSDVLTGKTWKHVPLEDDFQVRQHRGAGHSKALLTDADVLEIRRLRGSVSIKEIMERYGIGKSTVSNIWCGHSWKHLL